MFTQILTLLNTAPISIIAIILCSMLIGGAIAFAPRLIRKIKSTHSLKPALALLKYDQHWIHESSNPMLVFNKDGHILTRNDAFKDVCPKKTNVDLLNQVHHYFPKMNLAYEKKPQGPMTLLDQRSHYWQIYCFQNGQYNHILQLIPYKMTACQPLSTEIIKITQQLILSISHDLRHVLSKIREATHQLGLIHDLTSERAQFLIRTLHLEQNGLQLYFKNYHFEKTLSALDKATSLLHTRFNTFNITQNVTFGKIKKFSSKKIMKKSIEIMLKTKVAHHLTHQGYMPIYFKDTTQKDMYLIGDSSVFINSLAAIYEWIALPLCDQLKIITQKNKSISFHQKHAMINIKINHRNGFLVVIFQGHFIEDITPLGEITSSNPKDYTRSSTTTTEGFLALLQLQNLFKTEIQTEIKPDNTFNIFELIIRFPKQKIKSKERKKPTSEDFNTIEFIDTLSHDLKTINIKHKNLIQHKKIKKDKTIH